MSARMFSAASFLCALGLTAACAPPRASGYEGGSEETEADETGGSGESGDTGSPDCEYDYECPPAARCIEGVCESACENPLVAEPELDPGSEPSLESLDISDCGCRKNEHCDLQSVCTNCACEPAPDCVGDEDCQDLPGRQYCLAGQCSGIDCAIPGDCPAESLCLDGCRRPREPIDCAGLGSELELLHAGPLPPGTTTVALVSAEAPGTEVVVGHGTRISALHYLGADELVEVASLELGSASVQDLVGHPVPLPPSRGPAIGVADEAGGHLLTLTPAMELELEASFASDCEPIEAHLVRSDLGELQDLVLHTRCADGDRLETFYDPLVELPDAAALVDGDWARFQLHRDLACEARWLGLPPAESGEGLAWLDSSWLGAVEILSTAWARPAVGYRELVEGSWYVATRRFAAEPVGLDTGYYLYTGHYGTDVFWTSDRPLEMSARGAHAIRVGPQGVDVFRLVDGGACRQTISTGAEVLDLDLMHPDAEDPGVELVLVLADGTLLLYGTDAP